MAAAAAMEERKRRVDWASLHPDLLDLVAARVLAADVLDYISLRAVCARWRASAPSPRDPTLRDPRFRPRGWVALCDGNGVRPADSCEVAFLSTSTGRCVRVRLPEIQGHRIVGFTDGLLILLNKATTAVRVLHPFTGVTVDLPPIAPILENIVYGHLSLAWMRTAVSVSQHNLPSISGDAIYFYSKDLYPIVMYSVSSGTCEQLSTLSIIHDFRKRIRPSVRPFTLADHLFTYCSHHCWSRGLMFHEYHCIPRSWKDLSKKHRTQDCEVQFPSSRGLSS